MLFDGNSAAIISSAALVQDKDEAAVQSLLLLGSNKTAERSEIAINTSFLQRKVTDDYFLSITSKERQQLELLQTKSFIKRSQKQTLLSVISIPESLTDVSGQLPMALLAKSIVDGKKSESSSSRNLEKVNEDLSNALLSSSLVLNSLSKSRKEFGDRDNRHASSGGNLKRKRGILLPPSSKVPLIKSEKAPGDSMPTADLDTDEMELSPRSKGRRSSAERYRQRNHRRKQTFGNKLVRVVQLLEQYRQMVNVNVSFCEINFICKRSSLATDSVFCT
jgi:hypothetical protein